MGKREENPRPIKYVPRPEKVKSQDGKMVAPQHRPLKGSKWQIIRDLERLYFDPHPVYGPASQLPRSPTERYRMGALRRMPYEAWNQLMDALPRCMCGRTVAPIRVLHAGSEKELVFSCSQKCAHNRHIRRGNRRLRMRRYQERLDAWALSEAIG